MIRNLKALGLVLVAVLAVVAAMASVASAQQGKLTASVPMTLTGEELGTLFDNSMTIEPLGDLTCDGSTFTGHKYNTTAHELVESGATTVTITPKFVNCKAHVGLLGTRHAKVTMNGCDYVLHVEETTGGLDGTYGVALAVVCPQGKKIDVEVWNDTTSSITCTLTIGSQSRTGGHLMTTTNDIYLGGEFTGIHVEHEGVLCGNGTTNTAKLHTDLTIKAHNGSGVATTVSVTD